uniref:Uncharacterized protein n=1 Tax=Oryza brachyantha TaxID=4533 RepID=J3M8A2_ORYBR
WDSLMEPEISLSFLEVATSRARGNMITVASSQSVLYICREVMVLTLHPLYCS